MKYTYNDWLKGKIHRDYKNGLIPELKDVHITKGMLAERVYQYSRFSDSPDYLSKQEYEKIREAQREAFYKGVESQVTFELNRIKKGINGIGEAEFKEAVQVEIETCEETYKSFDINKRKAVNRREPAFYGIDHNKYKWIIRLKPGALPLTLNYNGVEGNPAFNEWFYIAVNRELKKQLIELSGQNEKKTVKTDSFFNADVMPHQDVVDKKFMELKRMYKVSTAFDMLKSELIDNNFEPSIYGLNDDPENFNRAVNKRHAKALKNK